MQPLSRIRAFWQQTRAAARAHLKNTSARRAPRGLTLIEIMVVLVILGLIGGAIATNVFGKLAEARVKTAKLELNEISNAIDLYKADNNSYPDSLQQLAPKYIKTLHKDPFGSDYLYVKLGENSFDVLSNGPDKAQGGGDDIVVHGGEAAATGTASGGNR